MKHFDFKTILPVALSIMLLFIQACSPALAFAQVSTVTILDTTFADELGGKVETSLGTFDDEITDFYVYFGSQITVCGKVGTVDSMLKHFGTIRLNPDGTFDSTFGVNGKSVLSWGVSDYPNSIYMESDGSVLAAGASGLTALAGDQVPSIFYITNSGLADSSFGIDGRIILRYDTSSSGAFTNIFPFSADFVACGGIAGNNSNGSSGFYAVCFTSNGKLDSTFGTNGKAFIPVQVHSVSGFLSANSYIIFCGVTDVSGEPIIVLGRLTPSGHADSTFGINGVKNTGIVLTAGTSITAAVEQDLKLLIAVPLAGPSQTIPFTLARFTTDGDLDTTYGTNGFSNIPIAPVATARGINIANSGETVINGSANGTLEHCATARIKQSGVPDQAFNRTGMDVIDVDNGLYSNYLLKFDAIGGKRYIGIGGTRQNGKLEFLVARFRDDTEQSAVNITPAEDSEIVLYPNPASTNVTIESGAQSFQNLRILDALGRETVLPEVWSQSADEKECSLCVSDLPDGIYYCIADCGGVRSVQKLIIAH
jgi:uncharacterized delta-60 repeat protein